MTEQRFQNGAFVFTRARGVEPRDPTELEPVLAKHGIESSIVPDYPGDRTAVSRAITLSKSGLGKEGLLLRAIKRTANEMVFGIVREQKDVIDERLDHDFESTVSWSAEPNPSVIQGDHPVAQKVAESYRTLRGKIVAEDWSASVTSFLENHDAARIRPGVYWIPPQRVVAVRQLGGFLAEIGIDLVLCEVAAEVRTVVQDVANESLDQQLDRLQAEVAEFDGNQKPSTYARRLKEYGRLRDRAALYADALGLGVGKAKAVLDELEAKVSVMLDLRRKTVVHRDGSSTDPVESSPTGVTVARADDEPGPSTEGVSPAMSLATPALRFAGARFELVGGVAEDSVFTFVGDDSGAIEKVRLLEKMGIAGKWQRLGSTKVLIKNSGPPGAAISIGVELPEGQDIHMAARSLSAIGIEVCEGLGADQ